MINEKWKQCPAGEWLTPTANKSDKPGESKGLKRLFFFAEGVKQYCPKDTNSIYN
jgi:hypothetical protein